jgi:hypothetical protein
MNLEVEGHKKNPTANLKFSKRRFTEEVQKLSFNPIRNQLTRLETNPVKSSQYSLGVTSDQALNKIKVSKSQKPVPYLKSLQKFNIEFIPSKNYMAFSTTKKLNIIDIEKNLDQRYEKMRQREAISKNYQKIYNRKL